MKSNSASNEDLGVEFFTEIEYEKSLDQYSGIKELGPTKELDFVIIFEDVLELSALPTRATQLSNRKPFNSVNKMVSRNNIEAEQTNQILHKADRGSIMKFLSHMDFVVNFESEEYEMLSNFKHLELVDQTTQEIDVKKYKQYLQRTGKSFSEKFA